MSIYSGSGKSISGDIRERTAHSQKQCLEFRNCSSWASYWAEEPWWPPSKGREELSEMEQTISCWRLSTLIDNGSSPKRPVPCQSRPNSGRHCPKMSSEGPLRKTHHENHSGAPQNHSRHEVFLPVSPARASCSRRKTDIKIAESQWDHHPSSQAELLALTSVKNPPLCFSNKTAGSIHGASSPSLFLQSVVGGTWTAGKQEIIIVINLSEAQCWRFLIVNSMQFFHFQIFPLLCVFFLPPFCDSTQYIEDKKMWFFHFSIPQEDETEEDAIL